jgi:colicin import membrane protein
VLLAAVVGFSSAKLPDAEEGIAVEIVTDNMLSEITKGVETAAKPQPDPKPRADRVADTVQEREPARRPRTRPPRPNDPPRPRSPTRKPRPRLPRLRASPRPNPSR